MTKIAAMILAAGKGTRMNSKRQKILHHVGGKPMVQHVYETAASVVTVPPIMIVDGEGSGVHALFGDAALYAVQAERLGTGHAVRVATEVLPPAVEQVVVLYGDMPLVLASSLTAILQQQAQSGAAIVMRTVPHDPPSSFGRILRDETGRVVEICEVAEAKRRPNADEILAIREVNPGIYCFDAAFLREHIGSLPLRQARSGQEYYLTDMIEVAVKHGLLVETIAAEDAVEGLGAGTRAELIAVDRAFRQRAVVAWLEQGVTIIDPDSTYIDSDARIGRDSIIWPNSYIQGDSVVGEDCVIGPNSVLRSAEIGDRCIIEQSVIEDVVIAADTIVPPFTHAYLRDEDSGS